MTTIPAILLAALLSGPPPIDCPPGTRLAGGAPPEQYAAWCEGRPDAYGKARRHGPARTWYDDGTLWIEERWVEGKRDGPFVEYHRNGKPAREGSYRLDEKVGTWTVSSERGLPEERAEWRDHRLHGPFATWYPNGKRRTEGRYCSGVQCGAWTTWDEEGRVAGRMELEEHRDAP